MRTRRLARIIHRRRRETVEIEARRGRSHARATQAYRGPVASPNATGEQDVEERERRMAHCTRKEQWAPREKIGCRSRRFMNIPG